MQVFEEEVSYISFCDFIWNIVNIKDFTSYMYMYMYILLLDCHYVCTCMCIVCLVTCTCMLFITCTLSNDFEMKLCSVHVEEKYHPSSNVTLPTVP